MSTLNPTYRMRVYQPRSSGAAETSVLAPIMGAVHSDNFQIATISGVSGYQPYMGRPQGRRGRLDPLTRRTDTGALLVPLQDQRTTAGGTNLERWGSAFLGNTEGEPLLLGLRAQLDESTDGGATWSTYFTGRISGVQLDGKLILGLELRDARDDLKVKVFVGRPSSSVSYTGAPRLLPIGVPVSYGSLSPSTDFTGTAVTPPGVVTLTAPAPFDLSTVRQITFDQGIVEDLSNIMTKALEEAVVGGRARAYVDDGSATGHFYASVGALDVVKGRVRSCLIAPLDSADPDYMAAPTSGTSVTFHLFADAPATENRPLIIGDVHPVTLMSDLLAGKFGYHYTTQMDDAGLMPTGKSVGDPMRVFPTHSSSFSTLSADTSIPRCRFVIEESTDLLTFIEEQLCIPFGLGYRITPAGEFEVLDLRVNSSTVGSPATIDDTDLDATREVGWSVTRDEAVNIVDTKYYEDVPVDTQTELDDASFFGGFVFKALDIPVVGFRPIEHQRLDVIGLLDMGEQVFEVNARGLRIDPDEIDANTDQRRSDTIVGQIDAMVDDIRLPFGSGVMTASLPCRRTSDVTGCYPGDWRLVDVDVIPDPGTNKRGGARLMRCIGRAEEGPRINLEFQDAGPNTVLNPPTVGALGAGTIGEHEITVPITVNAQGDPVVIRVAVTSTATGTIPADGSPLWVQRRTVSLNGTYTIGNLPSGKRVWVQARSVRPGADELKLPSEWAESTGTDYRDTTALSAPTSLSITPTSIGTTSQVTFAWTNPTFSSGYEYPVEILTQFGVTGEVVQRGLTVGGALPAGSTQYILNPHLIESRTYTARVRLVDAFGGEGTKATSGSFVTPAGFAGPALTAPSMEIV